MASVTGMALDELLITCHDGVTEVTFDFGLVNLQPGAHIDMLLT